MPCKLWHQTVKDKKQTAWDINLILSHTIELEPQSEDHSVSEGIFALDFYGEKYKTYMWGDLQLQLFCNQGVSFNHKMFIPVFG